MTTRSADPTSGPVRFDDYADDYDAALHQGLSVTGEGKHYFARRRIEWLSHCLQTLSFHPRMILDYGCGDGSSSEALLAIPGAEVVLGLDSSNKLLERAVRHYGKLASFQRIQSHEPAGDVDLVYCNGVFHHIAVADRSSAVQHIWESLRPGGLFALWENNPWNPGTRYVMSHIPFDRDAITLTPPEAVKFLQAHGFRTLRRDSLFYFPRTMSWLRWIEPYLAWLPLGGQYQVLAQKPV